MVSFLRKGSASLPCLVFKGILPAAKPHYIPEVLLMMYCGSPIVLLFCTVTAKLIGSDGSFPHTGGATREKTHAMIKSSV